MTHSSSWSLRSLSLLLPLLLVAGCYDARGERRGEEESPSPSDSTGPEGNGGADAGAEEPKEDEEEGAPPKEGDGGASSEAPDTETLPVEALPKLYAEAGCEADARCWAVFYEAFGGWDCVADREAYYEDRLSRWKQALDEGKAAYDASQVVACIAEMSAESCEDFLNRSSDACLAVLEGTVPRGGDCNDDVECSGDTFCDFFDEVCPGECRSRKARGDYCVYDSHCGDGFICSSVTRVCVVPGKVGDACDVTEPECGPGLFCAGADEEEGIPGECKSYETAFSRSYFEECAPLRGDLCEPGLRCAQYLDTQGSLRARCEHPAGSGGDCKSGIGQACPFDEYCARAEASSLVGECTPRPGVHEACGSFTGESEPVICAEDLVCEGGICRARSHLGESCLTSGGCYSGRCHLNVCVSDSGCDWEGEGIH